MIWVRALRIILQPAKVWRDIVEKPVSVWFILVGLILPLSIITSIVRLTGRELQEGVFLISISINVISVMLSVLIGSYMVWRLAPRFSSEGSYQQVLNLSAYSYIPVFLAFMLASIHPRLEIIKFFALYALFIYWTGLTYMLKTPDEKKTGFTFISALIFTGTGYMVSIILNRIIFL